MDLMELLLPVQICLQYNRIRQVKKLEVVRVVIAIQKLWVMASKMVNL